jgi:hypothetical protein
MSNSILNNIEKHSTLIKQIIEESNKPNDKKVLDLSKNILIRS